ncbi:hypothetical protein BABINDRAFT_34492 [Babjeviella inositovora NRRL Y-12698]|uniref:Uncharacterized protein n=1 Tax=Babjeviella inositovora NRRL Y-12698 TaxID=984486 RepID=A0A1E3QUW1_9ASCO|nr:uncharacterized protein BABINDRAFT_34492 [Babjeviella inositovora NRRL Y-12698]ODQ80822.1 hypothetical protein BABINDRAFT_34492 [Babjeviella inositovora NRRL Y-12698]
MEIFALLNAWIVFTLEVGSKWETSEQAKQDCVRRGKLIYKPNFLQRYFTYSWMNPLMSNKNLSFSDLPELPDDVNVGYHSAKLSSEWEKQARLMHQSLLRPLLSVVRNQLCVVLGLEILQCISLFVQPLLLRYLIRFFQQNRLQLADTAGSQLIDPSTTPQPLLIGLTLAFLMFFSSLATSFICSITHVKSREMGFNCRSSSMALVYAKCLRLSHAARTQGDTNVANLISVDVENIQTLSETVPLVVSIPVNLVISLAMLYSLIGYAFAAGFAVVPAMIYLNIFVSRRMEQLYDTQMEFKDARGSLTQELLLAIRSVKLYAWEAVMTGNIRRVRNDQELPTLKRIALWDAFGNFAWNISPFFLSTSVMALLVLLGDITLTPEVVFPTMAVLNLLSKPFYQIPSLVAAFIEGRVSFNRLTEFLTSGEIDFTAVTRLPAGNVSVNVANATFLWNAPCMRVDEDEERLIDETKVALTNINFQARTGQLSCVVGRVGDGKSAFIQSLAGELPMVSSAGIGEEKLERCGNIAYVPQEPWIMNASVKDNILFGHRLDGEFYQKTLEACALVTDLETFPQGDATVVGEKGISLSGGQRVRLSLARAVYARADIYLMDDVLSAVDTHVSQHIIDRVLSSTGILASRTRILATNNVPVLKHADRISVFQGGRIIDLGEYDRVSWRIKGEGEDSDKSEASNDKPIKPAQETPPKPDALQALRRASVATVSFRPFEDKEGKAEGRVSWSVYLTYTRIFGLSSGAIVVLFIALWPTFTILANYWLKLWSEENLVHGHNTDSWRNLAVYALLGLALGGSILVRSLLMRGRFALRASQVLHDTMLTAVVNSPMAFFESTPLGQIVNRFTLDINAADDGLARTIENCLEVCLDMIFVMTTILWTLPGMALLMGLLVMAFLYYQIYFIAASRELKRIAGIARSPLLSHIQETIEGVDSVRAYAKVEWFKQIHATNIENNLKADYLNVPVTRWLSTRLKALGSVVLFAATLLCVYSLTTATPLGPGTIGFIISYTLYLSSGLEDVVDYIVSTEVRFVAIERILEYWLLRPEADAATKINVSLWPNDGGVMFSNYSTKYPGSETLALKDISVSIKPGEKIGIVGRTGAGKSTLTLALFRLIGPTAGSVSIDGIAISSCEALSLHDLRSNLNIIPQNAHIFQGTIRSNLDPFNQFSDERVWECIKLAQIDQLLGQLLDQPQRIPGVTPEYLAAQCLSLPIVESGANLSSGQKQLVCLARALLNPSQVLVMDEATSSVDGKTDLIVQETIRKAFSSKTILTIAHRLDTVMNSDRILVLDGGEVKEFDTPETLLNNPDSLFYGFCQKGGFV